MAQLDPAPTLVEGVAGQADHMEWVHHRHRLGKFFGGGGLEAGKSVHGNNFHTITPGFWSIGQPLLEGLLGAAFDHVEQACRTGALMRGSQVDDHGDVLVTVAGVAPHVLIDPDHPHPVEPGRIVDQDTPTFGQHRVVGGVPRHPQTLCDAGHAQVLAHNGFQRPAQATSGEPGPGLGCGGAVLTPHMGAAGAPVAADGDQQGGGPPPERLVRKFTGDAVTHGALFAAPPAVSILVGDPAGQHRPVGSQTLPDHLQPELVEAAERGHIRASEGSVRHVEVFRMGSVRTPIIGGPRPLPRHRRADHLYTLICEEPENVQSTWLSLPWMSPSNASATAAYLGGRFGSQYLVRRP